MLSAIKAQFKQHYAAMLETQKCDEAVQAMFLDPDHEPFIDVPCAKLQATQLEKMQYRIVPATQFQPETLADHYKACFANSVSGMLQLIRNEGGIARFTRSDECMGKYTETLVDMMDVGMLQKNEIGLYYTLEAMLPETHHWGFANMKELIEPQMSAASWLISSGNRFLKEALPYYYKGNQNLQLRHSNLWKKSEFNPLNIV